MQRLLLVSGADATWPSHRWRCGAATCRAPGAGCGRWRWTPTRPTLPPPAGTTSSRATRTASSLSQVASNTHHATYSSLGKHFLGGMVAHDLLRKACEEGPITTEATRNICTQRPRGGRCTLAACFPVQKGDLGLSLQVGSGPPTG